MTYSLDLINLVQHLYINNVKLKDISLKLNIHVQTIYRWMKLYKNNILPVKNRIIISKINKEKIDNKIIEYVNKNKGCTLKDISYNINNKVSLSTIYRILKKYNITHKKINNHIIYKKQEDITQNRIDFVKENPLDENNIYIDESSFCIDDNKRYGYSQKGDRISIIKHARNRSRYSLIMAISKNKVECYKIVKNAVNTDIYLDFIKDNINIFKYKNIYQDNAQIHHTKKLKEYININKLSFRYNPPYSPEFNPIEIIFSKMKTLYRNLEHINIIDDIINTINKINKNDLSNSYKHTFNIIKNYL